jgi:hypothetical protein
MPSRSLHEIWGQRRRRNAVLREAMEAVRAESEGQNKHAVRELLKARLDSLGLTPPVLDASLDVMTDAIQADGSIMKKGQLATRVIADSLGGGLRAVNELRDLARSGGTNMGFDVEPIMIRFERSLPPLPVRLDPGIQEWLSEVTDETVHIPSSRPREIFVLLGIAEGQDPGPVFVTLGTRRIGTLSDSDSRLFSKILAAGVRQQRPVINQAIQERESSGQWGILVFQPPPEPGSTG